MSNPLMQFITVAGVDETWPARLASLLVLPFAHEDLATILGGYIVVNKLMPAGLVALCIYGGMVGSDFALYGIGAGARHLLWLSRWAVDKRVTGLGELLKRDLFGLVAFCRVAPGVDFIAFIACGWARVPLGRFLGASLLVSALYLPLMLYLVIVFGDALDDHLGLWAWPVLLAALMVIAFVRRQVFSLQEAEPDPPTIFERASFARRCRLRGLVQTAIAARRMQRAPAILPRVKAWLRSG